MLDGFGESVMRIVMKLWLDDIAYVAYVGVMTSWMMNEHGVFGRECLQTGYQLHPGKKSRTNNAVMISLDKERRPAFRLTVPKI